MKKQLFLIYTTLFLMLFISVCNVYAVALTHKSAKKFLFENPSISFKINNSPFIYDKYTYDIILRRIHAIGEIMTVWFGKVRYEVLLSGDFQRIGTTDFFVRVSSLYSGRNEIHFGVIKQKEKVEIAVPKIIDNKEKPTKPSQLNKKENVNMGLSLGTWIMLIIAIVIISKVSHKLGLRTLFKPTKRAAKTVKKEWDES